MNGEKGEEEGVTVCNVSVDGPCESVSSARSRILSIELRRLVSVLVESVG